MYWGSGKGKTTAALGLCLRALGRGFKVHLVQFLKGGIKGVNDFEEYGELVSLKRFSNFSFKRFGVKEWFVGEPSDEHVSVAKSALNYSFEVVNAGFDLVVLDELLYAVQFGLVDEDSVLKLIDCKAKNVELVLTGSHKPFPRIFDKANLVTEVRKVKHPFDFGVGARKGIEF